MKKTILKLPFLLLPVWGFLLGPANAQRANPRTPQPRAKASNRSQATNVFEITLLRFSEDNDTLKARDGFMEALRLDPTYSLPRYNLGVLAESNENWDEAVRWFEEFLRLDPISEYALKAQTELAGVRLIRELDKTPAGHLKRLYDDEINRARVFLNTGFEAEALDTLTKAKALDDSRWEAYAILSSVQTQHRDFENAISSLQGSSQRAPADKKDRLQQALDICQREWHYDNLATEGVKALESKDYQRAALSFTKAWQLFPDRGEYALAAATALAAAGDFPRAKQILNLVQDFPDQLIADQARALLVRVTNMK
jgi:tetratricopeptide (TPR) repeat protein